MKPRPRVLVLAPIRPARSGNGLAMRVMLFVEAAEVFADVDVVVVPVAGTLSAPEPPFCKTTRLHEAPAYPCKALSLISRVPVGERLDAFRSYGRPSLSGYLSTEAHELVARLVSTNAFALIVVMRSYMLPLTERVGDRAVLALDLDEDEYGSAVSQARIAVARAETARAAWLMAEANATDRLIALHGACLTKTYMSCKDDALALRRRHPGLRPEVINNAVPIPRAPKRRHDGQTLLFVGAFGHLANLDGIEWFVHKVVPRLQACAPRGFRLIIAGTGPPLHVRRLGSRPRVEIEGSFVTAAPLYARATIAIAPMRFGGGARTKLIEAAAHGVACVAHEESANAMLTCAGWTAGNALEFAIACAEAMHDLDGRRKREALGRHIAASIYDRAVVISDLSRKLALLIAV